MESKFREKLNKILRESANNPSRQTLNEDQKDSPTRVHPEKGQDVTHGVADGTAKVDATGPVPTGSASTLKTQPGNTTGGPTGHIPTNSDLPRPQGDGLNPDNKNAGKKYTLGEEADEEEGKEKVEEGKVPPFFKKKEDKPEDKKDEDGDKKDEKKEVKEESDKEAEDVKESAEDPKLKDKSDAPGKSGAEDNSRAGYSKKMSGDGEKINEESEDDADDKKAVAEATAELMAGEQLSEAFKLKTAAIFEEKLSKRIKEYRKKLTERLNVQLNERVEQIREELASKVDGHLDMVVESWVKQNEVPLETALKTELVEDFIVDLKRCFESHYIELPAEKVDVVAEMANRVSSLETKLNEQLEANVELRKQNKLHERNEVLGRVSKGLATTQVEKLKSLAERVEFKSSEQFETEVNVLKESVVATPASKPDQKTKKTLAEQTLEQGVPDTTTNKKIGSVKDTLARMAKN